MTNTKKQLKQLRKSITNYIEYDYNFKYQYFDISMSKMQFIDTRKNKNSKLYNTIFVFFGKLKYIFSRKGNTIYKYDIGRTRRQFNEKYTTF